MEKGGWLDQILLFVLGVLTNTWVGLTVALLGGLVVGYLARMSPKQDWEFIREGPGNVLAVAFLLMSSLRSVPRFVAPEWSFTCSESVDEFGFRTVGECEVATSGSGRFVVDYTLVDMAIDFTRSLVVEGAVGFVGILIGRVLAGPIRADEVSSGGG